MSKVLVHSSRPNVLTLCAGGDSSIRCILHQGDNKLDKEAWDKVKEQEAVKNLLDSGAISEKGEVKEAAKPAAKEVADQAPVAEESAAVAEDSHDEDEE